MAEEEKQEVAEIKGKGFPISPKIIIPAIVILIIVIASGGLTALGIKQKPEVLGLSKGAATLQAEADKLVAKVSKLIDLPTDEKPTVATITDISKLADQAFFKNAKNGDKVIIYTNAKKAILYRESENKILEVGAVNISGQLQATSANFALYNGTGITGLTKTFEEQFTQAVTGATIVSRVNAAKNDYGETILIDLTGQRGDEANRMAQALGIKVASLPEGENKPEGADFLIIVGKDKVPATATPTEAQ